MWECLARPRIKKLYPMNVIRLRLVFTKYLIGQIFVSHNFDEILTWLQNILTDENFVQYLSTKVRQNRTRLTKFRLGDENVVRQKFLPAKIRD